MRRNVVTLGLGQFCGHAVLLAATPLLTRIYDPRDFGVFASYGALLSICSAVITLRYEAAIPLASSRRQALHLLVLSCCLALTLAVVSGALFLAATAAPLVPATISRMRPFAVVLAVNLAACGGYQALVFWMLHERDFQRLAVARLINGLGTASGQVGLGLASSDPAGLIIGHGLGFGAGLLWMGRSAISRARREPFTFAEIRAAAVHFSRFPKIGVWGALLGALGGHLPALLLAVLFGPLAAGWYLLAERCLSAPMSLLQIPLSRVYLREVADLLRVHPPDALRLYRRVVLGVLAVAAVPLCALMLVAPPLFEWAFGTEWGRAGDVCRVLAPLILLQVTWNSVRSTLDVLGRQDVDCVFAWVQVFLTAAALVVPWRCGANIDIAVAGLSVCGATAYLVALVTTDRLLSESSRRQHEVPSLG